MYTVQIILDANFVLSRLLHFNLQSPFDGLQSALDARQMLLARPVSLRPDMSHRFPDMPVKTLALNPKHLNEDQVIHSPDINNLQSLLYLLGQILDVFPIAHRQQHRPYARSEGPNQLLLYTAHRHHTSA